MKKSSLFIGVAAAGMIFTGCSTSTTIYDPATTKHSIRQEGNVSSEEFREIAIASVRSATTSSKFNSFLRKYRKEMNDPDAIPVLKLDRVVNDTDDPDLNVTEMTDMINEALLNCEMVEVTMAEGVGRSNAIAASRESMPSMLIRTNFPDTDADTTRRSEKEPSRSLKNTRFCFASTAALSHICSILSAPRTPCEVHIFPPSRYSFFIKRSVIFKILFYFNKKFCVFQDDNKTKIKNDKIEYKIKKSLFKFYVFYVNIFKI